MDRILAPLLNKSNTNLPFFTRAASCGVLRSDSLVSNDGRGLKPDDFWIRVCMGIVCRQEGEGGLK